MRTRIEITSYDKIAFVGEFASFDAAEGFHSWWTNQRELPQGGATLARADKHDEWREAHPLATLKLTATQRHLIASYKAD